MSLQALHPHRFLADYQKSSLSTSQSIVYLRTIIVALSDISLLREHCLNLQEMLDSLL